MGSAQGSRVIAARRPHRRRSVRCGLGLILAAAVVVAAHGVAPAVAQTDGTTTTVVTTTSAGSVGAGVDDATSDSSDIVTTTDPTVDRTKERVDRHKQLLRGLGIAVFLSLLAFAWHTSPRRRLRAERKAAERSTTGSSGRPAGRRTVTPEAISGPTSAGQVARRAAAPRSAPAREPELPPALRLSGDRRAMPRPTSADRRLTVRREPAPPSPERGPSSPEPRKEPGGRPARRPPLPPAPRADDRRAAGSDRRGPASQPPAPEPRPPVSGRTAGGTARRASPGRAASGDRPPGPPAASPGGDPGGIPPVRRPPRPVPPGTTPPSGR